MRLLQLRTWDVKPEVEQSVVWVQLLPKLIVRWCAKYNVAKLADLELLRVGQIVEFFIHDFPLHHEIESCVPLPAGAENQRLARAKVTVSQNGSLRNVDGFQMSAVAKDIRFRAEPALVGLCRWMQLVP